MWVNWNEVIFIVRPSSSRFCSDYFSGDHSAQAQFSQMRPVQMAPSVAPRMQMYPPGGPGMGQQMFYGQGPAMIQSQVIIP